jgi:predicted PurR-regulated permease PerM
MEKLNNNSLLPPRWVLFSLFIGLFLWVLLSLKELVVLLVVSFCLAYVVEPIIVKLEARKIKRPVGAVIVFFSAIILLVLLLLTAVPTVQREAGSFFGNLGSYFEVARDRVKEIVQSVKEVLPLPLQRLMGSETTGFKIPTWSSFSTEALTKLVGSIFGALLKGYNLIFILANAILLPFITFYFIVDFKKIGALFVGLFSRDMRPKVREILAEINVYVSGFIRGQILVGATLTVLYWIGLGFAGIQLWFLLGVISGFGNIIPYFGFLAGIVSATIMALVTYGDLRHLVWVWVIYACVQGLESFVISPRILGKNVGMSPLTIILAIFIGGSLFGLLGVLLAVPGAAVILVLLRHIHKAVISDNE